MRKIGLVISAILLAVSILFAVQRVKGDEAARGLYPVAQKAAEVISKNGLGTGEEYQKFINDCNQAISNRNARKCEKLADQASDIRQEAEKLGKSLKSGQEILQKYVEYPSALESISELKDKKEKLEQDLSDLTKALEEKDGDQVDDLSKEIKKVVLQLNEELKDKTYAYMEATQQKSFEEPTGEVVREVYNNWFTRGIERYHNDEEYAEAYLWTEKAAKLKELYKGIYQNPTIALSDASLNGNDGSITVTFPSGAPEITADMGNLYVEEYDPDGNMVSCKVTDVQKVEEESKINVYLLNYGTSFGATGNPVETAHITVDRTQIDRSNFSTIDWTPVNFELGDALFNLLTEASQESGKSVVFVFVADADVTTNSFYYRSSEMDVDDIVRAAQMNDISIWVNDAYSYMGYDELGELIEWTGGGYLGDYGERIFGMGTYPEYLADYVSRIAGDQTYKIQYESQMDEKISPLEDRIVSVTLLDKALYCNQTRYWSDSDRSELKAIEEAPTHVATVQETTAAAEDEDYIFPDSDRRYLTDTEVMALSDWEKKIARNEIYARHGRKFKSDELQMYFNSKSWYVPSIEPTAFNDENMLNEVERYNTKLISKYEK